MLRKICNFKLNMKYIFVFFLSFYGFSQDLPFLMDQKFSIKTNKLKITEHHNQLKKVVEFHSNGVKAQEGYLKRDRLHGEWTYYNDAGEKICIANYNDGKKEGKWIFLFGDYLKEIEFSGNYFVREVILD